jgi:hypothetical protein
MLPEIRKTCLHSLRNVGSCQFRRLPQHSAQPAVAGSVTNVAAALRRHAMHPREALALLGIRLA